MTASNWSEIPSEPVRPGVRRRGFGNSDVLLVMNECEPGMELRPHSHEFDQIAMITAGTAIYHVGEVPHEVGPGSILLVPAGEEHYIEPTGEETVSNIDIFAPAREDYLHLLDWMAESPAQQ
jgi:quercetin dioxygenase-like cupin family protein